MPSRKATPPSAAPARSFAAPRPEHLQIISKLSHELRAPLQILSGYLEILAEDWGEEFSTEPLRIMERMRLSAGELTQTVENLLEYTAALTRVQALVRETVETDEVMAELKALFVPAARRKKIFLVWQVEPHLRLENCDRRRLVSVLVNLISNAIKFTERGGVTVKLRHVRRGHKTAVELEVSDTGIGMDQRRLEDAFAPFVQLSASSVRYHRGLGLGLALVRRNVKLLGASLEIRSAISAGTRIRVSFPQGSSLDIRRAK